MGGGRQELHSWGRKSDAAVDPGIAQHIPEEEKEEEAEAAAMLCPARVPNEFCCLAEGDLDADSGMSHSQEWTLALPARFEQVKPLFHGKFQAAPVTLHSIPPPPPCCH